MSDEDFFIDDVLENINNKKKKRKAKPKDKGGRGERLLCAVLAERFKAPFSRVIGSGNRISQVSLSESAKQLLTSDIVCPDGFKFSIECKFGYDVDLSTCFVTGNKQLDAFLAQAEKDAGRVKRKPLLCWKKDHRDWLAFIKASDAPKMDYPYKLYYRDWIGVSLDLLLQQPDSYFIS